MTTLDEAIEKGHTRYFKNSYWKSLYDDAPDGAKKYYDLIFSQQDGGNDKENDDEFKKRMEASYRNMTDADWDYLISNTTNQMLKHSLKEKREKFSKKG